MSSTLDEKIAAVYGSVPRELAEGLRRLIESSKSSSNRSEAELWNERDIVLITYADQIRDGSSEDLPLQALRQFFDRPIPGSVAQLCSPVAVLPVHKRRRIFSGRLSQGGSG